MQANIDKELLNPIPERKVDAKQTTVQNELLP